VISVTVAVVAVTSWNDTGAGYSSAVITITVAVVALINQNQTEIHGFGGPINHKIGIGHKEIHFALGIFKIDRSGPLCTFQVFVMPYIRQDLLSSV
jgi:hypothetical protein